MNDWRDEASCKGLSLSWFFEDYEEDKELAKDTDDMCFDCPVRQQCLENGVKMHGTGVHGGVYLALGKYSSSKNSHKLPYIQKKLEKEVNVIRGK